jgi:putative transcriptional regulator
MAEAKVPFIGMSLAGRILVARPDVRDPRFRAAMMLLLEHGDEGALAVVLNRPSTMTLADSFPDWEEMGGEPKVVFSGGPVDDDALICLGRPAPGIEGEMVLGALPVDLDSQPTLVAAEGVTQIRVFAGYAGWVPGQLEDEIAGDTWWVVDATLDDLFTDDPEGLWARVMRRQGGNMAWYAHFPNDARLN